MSVTSSTLIVGDSGSGKSSLLATLAEWVWKTYKKVSLLYYSDGGGFPSKMDALIRAGIIRAWKLRTRGEAFESCSRACQGYWPVEFIDPIAGETLPGVRLVKNIITKYDMYCPKCNALIDTQEVRTAFANMYTCECKTRVNLQNGNVKEEGRLAPFFKDVGAILVDGLTSMNDWIMEDMADKSGSGVLQGEKAAIGGKIVSGSMTFGGSNRSHYGYAQTRSMVWLQDLNNINGLTIGPVITARVQRAVDANAQIKVYGPQIAGQAKTSDVPAWVGNCLGTEVEIDSKGHKEWKLYLSEYINPNDKEGVIHLCKTRAEPGTMPDFLTDGPIDPKTGRPESGAKPFTKFNLGHFMELMERATKATYEDAIKAYPDAPGHAYLEQIKQEEQKKAEETKPIETKKPAAPGAVGAPRPVAPKSVPVAAKTATKPVAKPGPPGVKRGPGRPPKNPVPRPGK